MSVARAALMRCRDSNARRMVRERSKRRKEYIAQLNAEVKSAIRDLEMELMRAEQ
jgi:hypothetical protein